MPNKSAEEEEKLSNFLLKAEKECRIKMDKIEQKRTRQEQDRTDNIGYDKIIQDMTDNIGYDKIGYHMTRQDMI